MAPPINCHVPRHLKPRHHMAMSSSSSSSSTGNCHHDHCRAPHHLLVIAKWVSSIYMTSADTNGHER